MRPKKVEGSKRKISPWLLRGEKSGLGVRPGQHFRARFSDVKPIPCWWTDSAKAGRSCSWAHPSVIPQGYVGTDSHWSLISRFSAWQGKADMGIDNYHNAFAKCCDMKMYSGEYRAGTLEPQHFHLLNVGHSNSNVPRSLLGINQLSKTAFSSYPLHKLHNEAPFTACSWSLLGCSWL